MNTNQQTYNTLATTSLAQPTSTTAMPILPTLSNEQRNQILAQLLATQQQKSYLSTTSSQIGPDQRFFVQP